MSRISFLFVPILATIALALPVVAEESDPKTREADFEFLWKTLNDQVPAELMKIKGIDWAKVREMYAPRVKAAKTDLEFARLCVEVVGRLRDGHASIVFPAIKAEDLYDTEETGVNPGVGLAECEGKKIAVLLAYGDAAKAGLERGKVVLKIDKLDAFQVASKAATTAWERGWSSSERAARHRAIWTLLSGKRDSEVTLTVDAGAGKTRDVVLKRTSGSPGRCPKPGHWFSPKDLKQEGREVAWAMLDKDSGYLQIENFASADGGKASIEAALLGLKDAKRLIVDVRGNGGGATPEIAWPLAIPTAVLIDPGTLSAGEGFAAYFGVSKDLPKGRKNVRFFGQTTAGSSSAKADAKSPSGSFTVHFSTRGRLGVLNCGPGRMIEFYGVRPDQEVLPQAELLADGKDACVEAAVKFLGGK